LDFSNINFSIAREKRKDRRGRPSLDPRAMFKAFIVSTHKGFSECELETFLRYYPLWSRLCGFTGTTPFHASFSNFKRKIGENTLKKVIKDLIIQLVEKGDITLDKVSVDSSTLEADLRDTQDDYGYTQEGPFYGYKIHIACCADSELAVSVTVTTGNIHDSIQYMILL
jgi:transposase